jgi:putative redox protein
MHSRNSLLARPAGGRKIAIAMRDHVVVTDQPERAGGTDTAPTPLELLGAALAGCVALYVQKFCEAEGLSWEGVKVEAKPFWRENPGRVGRYDVTVHLPEGFPHSHRAAVEQAASDCPVHHTLRQMPEIVIGVSAAEMELAAPI